jgi:hypothetical protein
MPSRNPVSSLHFWQCLAVVLASCLLAPAAFAQQLGIELSWEDHANNEAGFRVERKIGEDGGYVTLASVGPDTEAYIDTDVNGGMMYCYRVKAFNIAGDSDYSNEACGTPKLVVSTGVVTASASPVNPPSGATQATVAGAPAGASDGGGGGCFIATAAFGSALAPEVRLLREARDRYLLPHEAGRKAVETYYSLSPPFADLIRGSDGLRAIVRFALVPFVGWAALALWSPTAGWSVPVLSCVAAVWLAGRRFQSR